MERFSVQEALDYCLANPDRLSAEALLNKFPEYRDELQPLLALSADLAQFAQEEPPPVPAERRAAMVARLQAAAAQRAQMAPAHPAPASPVAHHPSPNRRAWWWAIARRPALAAGAMAAILVAFLWWGAASALPDSPFYSIKLASENVFLNFAGSETDRARSHLSLASTRLDDIRTMQSRGKLGSAGAAIDNFGLHITGCSTLLGRTGDTRPTIATLLGESIQACDKVFRDAGDTLGELPQEAQSRVASLYNVMGEVSEQIELTPPQLPEQLGGLPGQTPTAGVGTRSATTPAPTQALPTRTPSKETPTQSVATASANSTPTNTPPGIVADLTATALVAATREPNIPHTTPTSPRPPSPTARTRQTPTLVRTATLSRTPASVPPNTRPTFTRTAIIAPSNTPIRGTRTPTIGIVGSTPTETPPPSATPYYNPTLVPPTPPEPPQRPTNTSVPPQPPPSPAPEDTPTSEESCNLHVREVSFACGSEINWSAEVENRGGEVVEANWALELLAKERNGGWRSVARLTGIESFSPGTNTHSGEIGYSPPPIIERLRVRYSLVEASKPECHVSGQSAENDPCEE